MKLGSRGIVSYLSGKDARSLKNSSTSSRSRSSVTSVEDAKSLATSSNSENFKLEDSGIYSKVLETIVQ